MRVRQRHPALRLAFVAFGVGLAEAASADEPRGPSDSPDPWATIAVSGEETVPAWGHGSPWHDHRRDRSDPWKPPHPAHPPHPPRVVHPRLHIHRQELRPMYMVPAPAARIVVVHETRESSRERTPETTPTPPPTRDADHAQGGLAASVGMTRYFGVVPLHGDMMLGARLTLAAGLPVDGSRWLSNATLGLTGGIDAGNSRGVDAQVWHAGAVFALGAPWSRDVVGVSAEGGLLGSRYYDGNSIAYRQSTRAMVSGPVGESMGPKFYGSGKLTLQVPLHGDVRPFAAGEFGATERPDGRLSGIVGVTGGVVWTAW